MTLWNSAEVTNAPFLKNIMKLLESITIERRFGGFLPVYKFTDGTQQEVSRHVSPSPALALEKALTSMQQAETEWWSKHEARATVLREVQNFEVQAASKPAFLGNCRVGDVVGKLLILGNFHDRCDADKLAGESFNTAVEPYHGGIYGNGYVVYTLANPSERNGR